MSIIGAMKQSLPSSLYLYLRSLYHQRKKTLSQTGQDFWVFGEVFNEMKGGFFLEVGSADGITFSNTFLLEKRHGWKGICIEANPLSFKDLRRVRTAKCVNVCLDSSEGEVEFIQRDVLGGIVGHDTDNKYGMIGSDANIIKLRTKTLASVLEDEDAPRTIDYVSIDVEGAEERILSSFAFSEYTFKCMTIERPTPRLRNILTHNGYTVVKEIPNHDVFYIHKSFFDEYQTNLWAYWSGQSR